MAEHNPFSLVCAVSGFPFLPAYERGFFILNKITDYGKKVKF